MTSRIHVAFVAGALAVAGLGTGQVSADPLENQLADESHCTDVDNDGIDGFDPTCTAAGVGHFVRQVCDYQWVEGCELTSFAEPGYAVATDPSPAGEFAWQVGAVHEHSGYSDGSPSTTPRDYFRAARTGLNARGNGVILDFVLGSEHSDNSQITPTTNAECLMGPVNTIECGHFDDNSFSWKWPSALRQATEETTDEFTAMRGFEWTNDFTNHMNVFFSTNFRNVKIDGSYFDLDRMWDWLRRPVSEGGGADALVTFNHPGGNPKLSPFDGGFPHTAVLAESGFGNWRDVAYVADIDDRVVGMEVNGGDDLEWFVRALTNGWHISPVAAEDHHAQNWASDDQGKTLILTKGRSAQDYYWAVANRRTVAVHREFIGGAPGQRVTAPTVDFSLDVRGADQTEPSILGSVVEAGSAIATVSISDVPAGARVAMVDSRGGLVSPRQIGVAEDGTLEARVAVDAPWQFVVVCDAAGDAPCGTDHDYSMVTAPIWLANA